VSRSAEVERPARPATDGRPDLRSDVHTGVRTYVVGSRRARPNLSESTCPFCPGGLEVPESCEVSWLPNRWPSMLDGRCEMILYVAAGELGSAVDFNPVAPEEAAQGLREAVGSP
jgi:galactose-1-phosphate uridylyltransferase